MGHVQSSWLENFMKYKDSDGLTRQKRDCDWCGQSFKHSTHFHCSSTCWNESLEQDRKDRMVGGNWLIDKSFSFVVLLGFVALAIDKDSLITDCIVCILLFDLLPLWFFKVVWKTKAVINQ